MDNLVYFPKNSDNFPTTEQEYLDRITEVRKQFSDEVASDAFESVMAVLTSYGVTIKTTEGYIKDLVFLEESIKAFIYRHKRIEHPFHDMIENVITVPGDEHHQEKNEKTSDEEVEKQLNK